MLASYSASAERMDPGLCSFAQSLRLYIRAGTTTLGLLRQAP